MSTTTIPAALAALALLLAACPGEETTPPADTQVDAEVSDAPLDGSDDGTTDIVPDLEPDVEDVEDTGDADDAGDAELDAQDAELGDVEDAGDAEVGDTDDAETTDGGDAADGEVSTGPVCNPECEEGQVCVADGVCLNDCFPEFVGFDMATVIGSLGEGWTPTVNHCGAGLGAYAYAPLAPDRVLELRAVDGSPDSTLVVQDTMFVDGQPDTDILASAAVPGSVNAGEVFPSPLLELDDAVGTVAFGYTQPFDPSILASPGEVFFGSLTLTGVPPQGVEAASNQSMAAIDANHWLVSAASVGNVALGPAIYHLDIEASPVVQRVVTGLGFANASVDVWGGDVLVSGQADPWPSECDGTPVGGDVQSGPKVFYLPLTDIELAAMDSTPIDAFCSAQELEIPASFMFAPDGTLITEDEDGTFTAHSWESTGGVFAITDSWPVTTNGTKFIEARGVPASGDLMLRHSAGYMVVTPTQ